MVRYTSGILSPPALKDTSSSSSSNTACRRRAPISSPISLESMAMRAISLRASSSKVRCTLSTSSSAAYCRVMALSVFVRMDTKSSWVRDFKLTCTGKRPCSSGIRSLTFATWNAPAPMNSMKSVRTGPYLVFTVEPSTMGRISRCTPSRLTSGPEPTLRPAILSISSRNTMPLCSQRRMASSFTASSSISLLLSS